MAISSIHGHLPRGTLDECRKRIDEIEANGGKVHTLLFILDGEDEAGRFVQFGYSSMKDRYKTVGQLVKLILDLLD